MRAARLAAAVAAILFLATTSNVLTATGQGPCLRCLVPRLVPPETTPSGAGVTPWAQSFVPVREIVIGTTGELAYAAQTARPGDLYWLLEGTYRGPFVFSASGTPTQPIVFRAFRRNPPSRVTLVDGATVTGADVWLWGIESTGNAGVQLEAPGARLINAYVHDVGTASSGVQMFAYGPRQVLYGTTITRSHHNLYAHNDYFAHGFKYLVQNVIANPLARWEGAEPFGLHAYASSGKVQGFYLLRNVLMNGKQVIGGSRVAVNERHVLTENHLRGAEFSLGFFRAAQFQARLNRFLRSTLAAVLWASDVPGRLPTIFENNVLRRYGSYAVYVMTRAFADGTEGDPGEARLHADTWNRNWLAPGFRGIGYAAGEHWDGNLAEWRQHTGAAGKAFDTQSVTTPDPSVDESFVYRNEYDSKRALVVAYDWTGDGAVTVDLAALAEAGTQLRVVSALNPFATPLFVGAYAEPIRLTVAEFGAFLVIVDD